MKLLDKIIIYPINSTLHNFVIYLQIDIVLK